MRPFFLLASSFLGLLLFPNGIRASELPWWDDFATISQVSTAEQAGESGAGVVLCGVADDPTWGTFLQRHRMVGHRQRAAEIKGAGQKLLTWFEAFGTTQAYVAQVHCRPDGSWKKTSQDPTLTALGRNHWAWQGFDGTGEVRWVGSANYFDADEFVAPWTRRHPDYGCTAMTYPDGRIAEGYDGDPNDPRNSRVWDAGCSKNVLGKITFEYSFNAAVNKIDPETKTLAGPLDGLLEVKEKNLGPPDPAFTPEEWQKLKSAKYAGVVSAGKDTACPIWIDYLEASMKQALSIGVDGLWVDNFSPWDNFNAHPNLKAFGEWSVAGFPAFLEKCVAEKILSVGRLKELGIDDLSKFDVRKYLCDKCREWGGTPENLSDRGWRDPKWRDDPIWRAYLVYKRRIGTAALEKYYSTVKRIAAEAGKPDIFVSGNDIPMFSLGWVRGELDMVSTELSWRWHLTSGPRGLMPPPLGSYVPIAKLGREHAKSRFVNAWYYVPEELKGKPNIARVLNCQGLANHLLPMPHFNGSTAGTPEVNADFFRFIDGIRPIVRNRIPYDEQIALYYSSSTQLMEMLPGGFRNHGDQPHSFSFYGWGTLLSQSHRGWRALPQWKVSEESLKPFKVVILPSVSVFDRKQLPLLKRWIENGGTLVIAGDFAQRGDEDRLFEKETGISELFVPENTSQSVFEKKIQNGKIVFPKEDPGYDFYRKNEERPAALQSLQPLLQRIVEGHTMRLEATNLPPTVGLTVYRDESKVFVDVNNTNIDIETDSIVRTAPFSLTIELPDNFRGRKPNIRTLAPDGPVSVGVSPLVENRVRIDVGPLEVYLCIVLE